jgi:hypothetical protein
MSQYGQSSQQNQPTREEQQLYRRRIDGLMGNFNSQNATSQLSQSQAQSIQQVTDEGRHFAETIRDNTRPGPEQEEAIKCAVNGVNWVVDSVRNNP